MQKKLLSIMLIFLLSFGVFLIYSPSAKAVKDFSVDIQPPKIGTVGTYLFTFKVEKKLRVHEYITLVFPSGTTLTPPIPTGDRERKERLIGIIDNTYIGSIPCGPCGGLPIIRSLPDGSLEMRFNNAIDIDPAVDPLVVVSILPLAGFTSPTKPGKYTYKMALQPEPTLVESPSVEFFESKLTNIKASVNPNGFYQPARIAISFKLGDAGKLKAGSGMILLTFPEGFEFTKLPSTFPPEWIQINGAYLGTKLKDSKNTLSLTVPQELPDSSSVEIIIEEKAGIMNPKIPGKYYLEIATTSDSAVLSPSIEIVRTSPKLFLSSNKVGRESSYTIQYIQDVMLPMGGKISITFPKSVQLPQTKVSQEILVNGVEVYAIDSKENIIDITLQQKIIVGEPVIIVFNKSFGIKNPPEDGSVQLFIKPEGYKEIMVTNPVLIFPQSLEIIAFTINDSHSFEVTDYYVNIVFDDNHLPQIGDEFRMDLGSPTHIEMTGKIDIKIEKETTFLLPFFNIKNPSAGTYTAVFSFAEQTASYDYVILPGKPDSKVTLTGGIKGKNDWWVEPPTINIESSDPEAQIFYYLVLERDDLINKNTPYLIPVKMFPGQYKTRLHFFSKNGYGEEKEKLLEIKVDSINPEMEILNPKNTNTLTNELKFKVEGKSFLTKMMFFGIDKLIYDPVMINGNEALISEKDDLFSKEVDLIEGDNQILIRSEDEAGNFVEKTFVVTRDSTPPELTITSPSPGDVITKNPLLISGKTETDTVLEINGLNVKIGNEGSFRHELILPSVGEQRIDFTMKDKLGNTSKKELKVWFGFTITLKIGQTSAIVNGAFKTVPLAPFIQKGRTLVPFRFIGEELRATITFQPDPKTKLVKTVSYELDGTKILLTIGSTLATVNGVKVKLEVPAQIIKGSTVVPLRFVTEGLGCTINWEPKTQTITLWYPKLGG